MHGKGTNIYIINFDNTILMLCSFHCIFFFFLFFLSGPSQDIRIASFCSHDGHHPRRPARRASVHTDGYPRHPAIASHRTLPRKEAEQIYIYIQAHTY